MSSQLKKHLRRGNLYRSAGWAGHKTFADKPQHLSKIRNVRQVLSLAETYFSVPPGTQQKQTEKQGENMKKLAMITAGVLWAAGAFAQSPCREEWRGFIVLVADDAETLYTSVQYLMVTYGYQPVGGTTYSDTMVNGNERVAVTQALSHRNCIDDARTDEPTPQKLNADLAAQGLPALVGKK